MRTNRRVLLFCVVIFALMLSGLACGPDRSAPAKHAPAKNTGPQKPVPPNIGVVSGGFSFNLPDPKHPGKVLYDLQAASGTGQSAPDGFHITATSVRAKLFQDGAATTILTAPRAQGVNANKSTIVTGTGGVVVKSLLQPGTILTADTVIWYATLNKLVATGHVYYRDGQNGATMHAPRMVGDTRLKTLTIPRGHGTMRL